MVIVMWSLKFKYRHKICPSKERMAGKTVVITGASDGIGKEIARDLYWRGAHVILACRNERKARLAVDDMRSKRPKRGSVQYEGGVGELYIVKLDLTRLSSVRRCARQLNESDFVIDVLINNAATYCFLQTTIDVNDRQFQVNYLGHFLLTMLLLPKMRRQCKTKCRIINVTSSYHKYGHIFTRNHDCRTVPQAYAQSKLAQVLFTRELAKKLEEHNIGKIRTYAVNPGETKTILNGKILKGMSLRLQLAYRMHNTNIKSPELGAQSVIFCAVNGDTGLESGHYYENFKIKEPGDNAKDKTDAEKLWKESLRLIGLPPEDDFGTILGFLEEDVSSNDM